MVSRWEHRLAQAELSQALYTGGESTKPAISARIISSCDLSWSVVSSAGQLLILFKMSLCSFLIQVAKEV